jgi:hypothetical protein
MGRVLAMGHEQFSKGKLKSLDDEAKLGGR